MRATVKFIAFLPLLEAGACIVTPGKRLAREITDSWVKYCETDSPVIATPRVTTVDSWLERHGCALWRPVDYLPQDC